MLSRRLYSSRNFRGTVAKLWSTNRPSQALFESLMCDFSTRGIVQNINFHRSMDGISETTFKLAQRQRLLQYYQSESADIVSRRILGLNLADRTVETQITNGIDSYGFIDAIRSYPNPLLAKSLNDQLTLVKDSEIRELIESVLKEWPASQFPNRGFTHANRFRCAAFFRDFPRVGYLVNRMSPVFGQSTQLQSENRAKTYWRCRTSATWS